VSTDQDGDFACPGNRSIGSPGGLPEDRVALLQFGAVRILSHYFVSRFLGLFVMVLAAAILVLATIELVLNLDELSEARGPEVASSFETLRVLGLRLTSYYLADIIPVASFVAAFLTFALSGRATEILAIEAGGIPPVRIIVPVLVTALILSLATALLHETVILDADRIWSGQTDAPEEELDFGRSAFWMRTGPMITRVGRADEASRSLYDVEIFDRAANGAVARVILADRVEVDPSGRWRIQDARIWRFDPRRVEVAPRFEEHATVELDPSSMNAHVLRGADPVHLPIRKLHRYLAAKPTDPPSVLRRMRAQLHERLASPWLVLVFAWLAIPMALRVDQRGHIAGPAVAAVVLLATFFMAQTAGESLAQQELFPVGWTPWLTIATFSLLTGFMLKTRRR
jgi:lipopolysaccharide export system permease protein